MGGSISPGQGRAARFPAASRAGGVGRTLADDGDPRTGGRGGDRAAASPAGRAARHARRTKSTSCSAIWPNSTRLTWNRLPQQNLPARAMRGGSRNGRMRTTRRIRRLRHRSRSSRACAVPAVGPPHGAAGRWSCRHSAGPGGDRDVLGDGGGAVRGASRGRGVVAGAGRRGARGRRWTRRASRFLDSGRSRPRQGSLFPCWARTVFCLCAASPHCRQRIDGHRQRIDSDGRSADAAPRRLRAGDVAPDCGQRGSAHRLARIVRPVVHDGKWNAIHSMPDKRLLISLELRDIASTGTVAYRTWAGGADHSARLIDGAGTCSSRSTCRRWFRWVG